MSFHSVYVSSTDGVNYSAVCDQGDLSETGTYETTTADAFTHVASMGNDGMIYLCPQPG